MAAADANVLANAGAGVTPAATDPGTEETGELESPLTENPRDEL